MGLISMHESLQNLNNRAQAASGDKGAQGLVAQQQQASALKAQAAAAQAQATAAAAQAAATAAQTEELKKANQLREQQLQLSRNDFQMRQEYYGSHLSLLDTGNSLLSDLVDHFKYQYYCQWCGKAYDMSANVNFIGKSLCGLKCKEEYHDYLNKNKLLFTCSVCGELATVDMKVTKVDGINLVGLYGREKLVNSIESVMNAGEEQDEYVSIPTDYYFSATLSEIEDVLDKDMTQKIKDTIEKGEHAICSEKCALNFLNTKLSNIEIEEIRKAVNKSASYTLACSCMKNGEYGKALNLLEKIQNVRNAAELIRECKEEEEKYSSTYKNIKKIYEALDDSYKGGDNKVSRIFEMIRCEKALTLLDKMPENYRNSMGLVNNIQDGLRLNCRGFSGFMAKFFSPKLNLRMKKI